MLAHFMLEAGGELVKTVVPNTPLPSHSGWKALSAVPNGWSGNTAKNIAHVSVSLFSPKIKALRPDANAVF